MDPRFPEVVRMCPAVIDESGDFRGPHAGDKAFSTAALTNARQGKARARSVDI